MFSPLCELLDISIILIKIRETVGASAPKHPPPPLNPPLYTLNTITNITEHENYWLEIVLNLSCHEKIIKHKF